MPENGTSELKRYKETSCIARKRNFRAQTVIAKPLHCPKKELQSTNGKSRASALPEKGTSEHKR